MAIATLEKEEVKLSPAPRNYDKRYFPRWEVNKRVEYSKDGRMVFWSYTKDLSLDGVAIFVLGNPPEDHHVKLKIHLALEDVLVVRGRIAWRRPAPTHQLLGIVFEGLSKRSQSLIMRHAFKFKDDRLMIYG